MPAFKYRAVGPAGGIDTGTLTAKDAVTAQRQLRALKMTPLSVTPTTDVAAARALEDTPAVATPDIETARVLLDKVSARAKPARARKTIGREDVLRFTGEMAVLLQAGLPLDRAIKVQIESAPEGAQRRCFRNCWKR